MSFFGASKQVEQDTKKAGSGCSVLGVGIAAGALLLALAPVAVVLFIVCIIVGERRRVRLSRWAAGTVVASVASFAVAGFNLNVWLDWLGAAPALLFGQWIPTSWEVPILSGWEMRNATHSAATLLWQHTVTAVPLALAAMTLWWWWRSYELRLRGENEGEEYSNMRPVGVVDNLRAEHNEKQVRSGNWSAKNPNNIAMGVGTYGDVASADIDDLKKSIFIAGTSRSGKTRLANSVAAQQVMEMGSGCLVIDYKGDEEVVKNKAELARRRGVPFLHFQPIPPTGGTYRAPHPYAPDKPAHYDPLQRGNGASKAAMLLNSVPREGDAAVYLRKADEAVKLAFDLAALTGFDQRKTRDGHPISGMQLLSQMLDGDMLVSQGKAVTVEHVLRANPFLSTGAAKAKVDSIHHRIAALEGEMKRSNSTLAGALEDVRSTVASYANDSAAGPFLTPGSIPSLRIDLVRAILRGEIVVFSLSAQDYPQMSAMIGAMVLLDLQNAVSMLRGLRETVAPMFDDVQGDRPGGSDGTPWNPFVLQIEELGSNKSPAAAEALLGLLNKSADVGIRPVVSSQSLADVEAVDGQGIWLRQMMAQLDHLVALQLSEAHDAELVATFSGLVSKKIATEQRGVTNNRTGLFQGSDSTGNIIGRPEERTRIGAGEALQLNRERGEFFWISKAPNLAAVHTTQPEGPNNWSEKLRLAPVYEPPKDWNPYSDNEFAVQARQERDEAFRALLNDLRTNPVLNKVLDTRRDAVDVEGDIPATASVLPLPPEPAPMDAPADPAATSNDDAPFDGFGGDDLADVGDEDELFGGAGDDDDDLFDFGDDDDDEKPFG